MEYVCIYNRCSTEEESQVNALQIQAEESRELVNSKQDWLLVKQYVEAQSGTSCKKRTEYLRMLDDIENHMYTIVVIKSVDRLARNTKDWYLFLDCIMRNKVKLFLYLEQKFYTPDDSLSIGIKAILAEEFSRELSKKIKNSHKRRREKCSDYNITCEMFGWNKLGQNRYEINEKEAEAYRQGFELAEKGYGFRRISNYMYEKGVRNRKNGKISDVQWRKMLRSKRACGTMVLHCTEKDFETGKRYVVPIKERIVIENALPPIVSREYQERVLKVLDERAKKTNICKEHPNNIGRYPFSGKIICMECGAPFYRCKIKKDGKTEIEWKCKTTKNEGIKRNDSVNGCVNIRINEKELYQYLQQVCEQKACVFPQNEEIIKRILELMKKVWEQDEKEKTKEKLEGQYVRLKAQKDKLFEKLLEGVIGDDDFLFYRKKTDEQMHNIKEQIERIKIEYKEDSIEDKYDKLKKFLQEEFVLNEAKMKEILKNIRRISVYPDGKKDVDFYELL